MNPSPLNVWLVCTGVGVFNRGIETFFRDCFDGLRPHLAPGDIRLQLLKGAGPEAPPDEHRLWCLPRTGRAAALLGRAIRRTPYVAEQLSSVLPLFRRLRAADPRPDVLFTSDGNLLLALRRGARLLGATLPPILFSNGGPVNPPFPLAEHVQQVTPVGMEHALAAGESPGKHTLAPYGMRVPAGDPEAPDIAARRALRVHLDLPSDSRPLLLSVGWINRGHKRMDYTVSEVAALPTRRRPHLVLLGAMDAASDGILSQARGQLGPDGFTARSVSPEQVADYYRAADVFTLASLHEGFGRVYLEALVAGLPCIVHDAPTMRYVLGAEGTFADLARPGALTDALTALLPAPDLTPTARARRRESVRARFGWEALAPAYAAMFRRAAVLNL